MNKKIVTLITAIFCCFIIVLVSLIGAISEDEYIIKVETIEFTDLTQIDGKCQLTEDGDKIIYIPYGTTEYQLTYIVNPSDATDLELKFTLQGVSEDLVSIDSKTGLITFHKEVAAVTAKINNINENGQWDFVTIEFGGYKDNVETKEPTW